MFWTKFECILLIIPKKKSEWTRQGETIYLGEWIRPVSAVSRPQDGSGRNAGEFRTGVFGKNLPAPNFNQMLTQNGCFVSLWTKDNYLEGTLVDQSNKL